MQLTSLSQSLKGLARLDPQRTSKLQEALEHTKWNLWHGKVKRAHEWLRLLEGRMWHFATRYAKFLALARAVHGFQRYLWRNGHLIPNYAAWRRAGQAISTAFVESLVNSLLSKRFSKKQSMQWTPEGAHLLLQIRRGHSTANSRPPSARGIPPSHSRTSPPATTCSRPDRPRFVMRSPGAARAQPVTRRRCRLDPTR
jgi:hypothetical protein